MVIIGSKCDSADVLEHLDRDGFDAIRRGIGLRVASQHALDAMINLEVGAKAWVIHTQLEERLANRPYVILNRSKAEGIAAWR